MSYLKALGLLVLAAATGLGQVQTTGTLRGRITVEGNRGPIPGAEIQVYRLERTARNAGPKLVTRVFAAANGNYEATGLTPGRYVICVDGFGSDLLVSCDWSTPQVHLVGPGETITGVDRALEFGKRIEVDVDDPGENLDKSEVKGRGVHLLVGVWGPDMRFRPARMSVKDKKTRTYSIVVPFDTDLKLDVRGRKMDLDDASGRAKQETDLPESFREPKSFSRLVKKVAYKVKGVKP